jgi:2-dehydropantoate 2-reductase
MRVAVMGTGGIGGFLGALLLRGGHDVTLIARGDHLEALRANGLSLQSPVIGDITVRAPATDRCDDVGPVDLVLMCVKTYDLESAALQALPLVGTDTVVLPIQNGVDAVERLGHTLGDDRVIAGITYVNAHRTAPGVIRHAVGDRLVFGEVAGGLSERTGALWEKFAGICGAGAVPALTRLPLGPVLACSETREFLHDAVTETVAVGRARGVGLPEDYAESVMQLLAGYPPSARSSMLEDVEAGRRLELDALTGTVVRLGRECGVPTPVNTAIYAALKPYVDGAPEIPA